LVTGIVFGLVGASLLFFLLRNPNAERQVVRQLDFIATLVTTREGDELAAIVPGRFVRALGRIEQFATLRGRAVVLDGSGQVLADSQPASGWVDKAAVSDILSGVPGSGQFTPAAGSRWLYVSRSIGRGRTLVLAAPRPSVKTVTELSREFLAPLVQACLIGLVVSAGLAWITARGVSGPLQRMAGAARAVSRGDLSVRMQPTGPEEVRSLSAAFNEMVGRVQTSQQAQRDFVANVSHELKTPLTSIQGFAQAILDGAASDESARRKSAQVIYDESDRLRRLVEDLLDLARYDAGQTAVARAPLDLAPLLKAVTDRLALPAKGRGVRIELAGDAVPRLSGDGDRLAQVFTNLLDNAVQHSPDGATVSVRTQVERGWLAVHVEDRGPGIPESELSRIFERFYQLDKARPGGGGRGAGLGLAISRQIVQAHGGTLTASSRVGVGSTFTVRLPVVGPDDSTQSRRKPAGTR
jgi:signal transduction histidine kinase